LATTSNNDGQRIGATEQPIALMFTDVVGSSAAKRAAALGSDVNARDRAYLEGVQAKHLRQIRTAIAEHNGKEIMTIGDSFFLTFENPADAIRCSAAIQQRLYAEPIDTPTGPMQLRIGIHVGTPEYFENSWHGTDVDIAARVNSAGSPGQIVVTEAARHAMGDPSDIQFRPLGTFALKGVGSVRLWDADYDRHKLRRAAIASIEQRFRRRIAANASFFLVLALLAGGAAWRWREGRVAAVLASAAKQSIVVADFENLTGDPIFDHTITNAFTAQLEQSPVLKLVSQEHLRQSMTYLGKSPDDQLTAPLMREIGIREGVKAYLAGSIARLGNEYIVTVRAKDITTGDDIVSEQATATDKDHVFGALDKVAAAMRRHLGESLTSIQKLDAPLGQATTPSLEAFRSYALGDVEHEKGHDTPQAEGHYRQAVEIDPNFAMAWARLGIIALNSGEHDQAAAYFTKAFQLSKNVSERERLYIEGHYYQNVLGDLPKAISTLDLATRTYPLDFNNYVNLGIAHGTNGQMEDYLTQFEKAAQINPNAAVAQVDILGAQLTMDKIDDATATLENMKHLGMDHGATYFMRNVLMLDFLKGNQEGMQQTIARVKGRPDEFVIADYLAAIQEFNGRFRDAKVSWRKAEAQVVPLQAHDLEAAFALSSVQTLALMGHCDDVPANLRRALALDKSKGTLTQAAFVASLCHDEKIALPILTDLAAQYPSDTLINHVTIPQSRAALALGAHKPAEALHDLEGSKQFDLVSPGAYLRGMAYLSMHDGKDAVGAFQAATQYRGAAFLCCGNYPQAQLGLARAYLMDGNTEEAKNAYRNLLVTWKNADPDLPQFVAAKKEFAGLR
jgi:eukaryotic-like serine/threonine-protein kinase